MKAEPMDQYPIDVARQAWVGLVSPRSGESGEKRITWCNSNWFESSFYFKDVQTSTVDLEFTVESSEPVWISNLTIHPHADIIYRLFDNGLVLANPSNHKYTFNMEQIDPNRKYRRLIGSSQQDTKTNDGSLIGTTVTLQPLDALFLTTTK
jgi:hypothetical protein